MGFQACSQSERQVCIIRVVEARMIEDRDAVGVLLVTDAERRTVSLDAAGIDGSAPELLDHEGRNWAFSHAEWAWGSEGRRRLLVYVAQ